MRLSEDDDIHPVQEQGQHMRHGSLINGILTALLTRFSDKSRKVGRIFGRANMQTQSNYNPSLKKINVLISLVASYGRQIQHFGYFW
jgi:hypothetical protein